MTDFKTIERTLHLLAKRKNPKYTFVDEIDWYTLDCDLEGHGYYKCLICNLLINHSDDGSKLNDLYHHAILHIKEYNLAAFL